jgi:hypothetical protein
MSKAQVLVTLTAEAVIEVPEGVEDVEAYCREQVSFAWGDLAVEQVVQAPAVTVAHFPLEAEAAPAPEEAAAEPEPAEAPAEPGVPLVDAARAVGATLGKVAASIEGLAASLTGGQPGAETEAPAPVLTREEILQLFTDPIYKDMIRTAVRDRAARYLESTVSEVVAELEPLLRRQLERRAPNA